MNWGLVITFLFAAGCMIGWCLEFGYRNLISHEGPRGRYFINPGFCRGPWLPIYGIGLTVMFLITWFLTPDVGTVFVPLILIGIGLSMTLIEFIGGFLLLHLLNMRLWDYRKFRGNILGFVCPQFSLIWTALGALYYLFVHPLAIDGLIWLSHNLAFSFMIGLFCGLFIIDFNLSNQDAMVIREFGEDEAVVIKYEELRQLIQEHRLQNAQKARFFNQTSGGDSDLRMFLEKNRDRFDAKK